MDSKYIQENNLNEAYNRFQQINEYVLNIGKTSEAQDNNQQGVPQDSIPQNGMPQQDNMQQQPPMDGGNQQPDMQQQQAPDMNMPQDDMQQPTTPDPTIGADSEMPDDINADENGLIEPEVGGEDEVIDVDDLTQSQETTEYKLDGVDDKLSQLINIVSKFAEAIDDNDEKISELKREIEQRNPSQEERLNIRSMSGSPYNVKPQDYWTSQNARNPQYNVVSDNDVDPDKEEELFTITDDDLKNFNKDEIEKSINNIPKNLKDYFN